MKIKKHILSFCLIGAIGLQGCENFLDTYPKESYSDNTVWATQGTVDAFVTNCYASAYDPYLNFSMWDKTFSNNMVNCRHSCPAEARGLMENTYGWGLNDRFGSIRNCNLILEKVAQSNVLNENFKKRYTAEAKMMRAMIYYDLARKGGRYMWVDKVLNAGDEFNIPLTKDIVESYSHVLTDLREAIVDLPEEKVPGRLNKNAGLALLSEVCLTAAAYTDDNTTLRMSGKSLYQEVVEAVNAIKNVELDSNYESMFNQTGAYSSSEIILARYWSADNTQMMHTDMINMVPNLTNSNLEINGCGPLFSKADIFECWLDHTPSQNLVDAYLVIDAESRKAVRWYESSQFKKNTKSIGVNEAMIKIEYKDEAEFKGKSFKAFEVTTPGRSISDLMYGGRDKRFDASIIHDGSKFLNEDITTYNHGNMSRWATKRYAADHVPLTNYSTRKYIYSNMSPRPFYNVYTDYHKILFRYGRALLNKAEALLRLGQISEAVATLNQTRTIHGGLPASEASTAVEAWNDYKTERRVELFWEGDFYFSLLRWGKYGREANDGKEPGSVIDELCEPATFIEINKERTAAFVGNVQQQNDQRKFDIRSYLFPITKSVIQANSAISDADQNKGWE
ncbi:putative outer membrane starch-binding protein [Bacteroides zoogleoformans]|uniref:RagB/SusD family nutrient uptake outer membrane protein n=1 Tax=Bacteroides zoogleoformans TaxID=28119 RepID=A0ABN5IK30_9BACE|nr:RagB/SusD family nutrient uptake outer membrane protein [Bacteroides zoogleoformans]AVM53157.1 RagB/SusD family nutrient uptake outer membrane protein [Bacteroides zoogleoformans]TWJ17917.1 putative outer membrane starch-binding protein [Bacteroides zoogleoformans]